MFRDENFTNMPGDWQIIIADVKNSTAAVKAGNHNDVNLVAASSLVLALNIAKSANIEIPFFFTGDGGTLFVPASICDEVLQGLKLHNDNSLKNFGLEIHFGSMAVAAIEDSGYILKIAKAVFGKTVTKAIVIGNGIIYAEQLIKASVSQTIYTQISSGALDMEGLECRWDKIQPPTEQNEVVCYLIEATVPDQQIVVYGDVLTMMDQTFGGLDKRNPISIDRLKLMLSVNKIKKEMMVKFGDWKRNYLTATFLKTFIGKLYFKYNWKINNLRGQQYLQQVITNADTLTIDGRINTIVSSTADKRIQFVEYLKREEAEGKLVFGHYISRESVMTCYIENRDEKHIHFVDGADGGYTEASKELKQKLAKIKSDGQL